MPSRLLEPSSKISTFRRCANCGVTIDDVAWKQCTICRVFDLCPVCAKLDYDELLPGSRNRHQQWHREIGEDGPITSDCQKLVLFEEDDRYENEARKTITQRKLDLIRQANKIENDYEMFVVLDTLKELGSSSSSGETPSDQLNSLIAGYQLEASQRIIRVLSLDGGGVRGYMPIKILAELIAQKYLSTTEKFDMNNSAHKDLFDKVQPQFTSQFDYFVGTSTGGLIAFCLAMNHNILDMMGIYSQSSHYFKRNHLGPLINSKYDPSLIHQKIDEIISEIKFKDGTSLSAEQATLLDIRNLLNPDNIIAKNDAESIAPYHGNFLEFVDEKNFREDPVKIDECNHLHRVKDEKVLLITAYNTTTNSITIFNTSYSKHWNYRIADVLKATMAAPTYFPPYEMYQQKEEATPELFIDGGVFANDPELAALAAVRMQWKKPANYHLLSIGTGSYTTTLSSATWGGYVGWIFNNGFLVNTLMDATRSFIETITSNLAKFNGMRRMKLNYQMTKPMDMDDGHFVNVFDQEWEMLKTEADFKSLAYFYDNYITKKTSFNN